MYSLSALPWPASTPVDIRPLCLGIRPVRPCFLALIGPHRRFPPMRHHPRSINRRRTIKSPCTPVSRPRSVNRPKSSSGGIRARMRLLFAACGLTGRYWVLVDHTCCLWPCQTPETKIVHVLSLSALPTHPGQQAHRWTIGLCDSKSNLHPCFSGINQTS